MDVTTCARKGWIAIQSYLAKLLTRVVNFWNFSVYAYDCLDFGGGWCPEESERLKKKGNGISHPQQMSTWACSNPQSIKKTKPKKGKRNFSPNEDQ